MEEYRTAEKTTLGQKSERQHLVKLDAELEARVSQASPQWQNAGPKTHVSVITALITGSITAHVMRELTPVMECFYGTLLHPETSINSPVYYGRGVGKNLVRRTSVVSRRRTKKSS